MRGALQGALRWVLWDVKDTLLKVQGSVGEQYCREAQRAGLSLGPLEVEAAFRQAYRHYSTHYPTYGLSRGLDGRAWWVGVVRDTFSRCRVQDPALLDTMAHNLYYDFCSPENWEVFPDSKKVLEDCSSMGLQNAVVSNFDKRLEGILSGCGLLSHFSFLLTSEEAGVAKPDPAIFHRALERCGVPAGGVAHVGDHYVNDYVTSRSLGLHGFLLDRHDKHPHHPDLPPTHRLRSLDQLPARLQQLID